MRILAAAGIGSLIALAAIGSVAPLQSVWQLSGSQADSVTVTSVLGGFRARALSRTVRDVVYATVAAAGAGGLAALSLRGRPATGARALFLACWAVPYLATCLLVHFAKPGYALPLLAPLALWISAGFAAVSWRRTMLAVGIVAALNTAQFALATPWPEEDTGGRRRYAEKTLGEKLRTELNSILRPSLHAVRENDALVRWLVGSSSAACGGAVTAVLVAAEPPVSWRQAMFYLPESTVVQVPGPRTGWLIARHGRLEYAPESDIVVRAGCTVLTGEGFETLGLPGSGPDSGEFVRGRHTVRWTQAPFAMRSERDGKLLQVRPAP